MSFRITTNMMMNSYRYNLMGSTNRLSRSEEHTSELQSH